MSLKEFDADLSRRVRWLVLNKIDLISEEDREFITNQLVQLLWIAKLIFILFLLCKQKELKN